jgi:hypothetical protein
MGHTAMSSDAVAPEVLPAQAAAEEDPGRGAAPAAQRNRLLVLVDVAVGRSGGGERDLEGLWIDPAQEREGHLHLLGGDPGQPVRALLRGRVGVRVRIRAGLRESGVHDCSSRFGGGVVLGRRGCW